MDSAHLELPAIQAHLANARGRDYWRSLEELAGAPEFEEFLHREFPRHASEWLPSLSRRGFLRLMGASLALAGLTSCIGRAPEKIVPYVQMPEETVPGKSFFYATAMSLGGYALGLLAQSQLNRPTKLEGNPSHPASQGATDAIAQASILDLYDPDRSQTVLHGGEASTWQAFLADLQPRLGQLKGGAGLHILTETVTSPTLYAQLQAVLAQYPQASWHQYEPLNRDNVYAGAQLAFGAVVEPVYHFDQADVVVGLDADFIQVSPGRVRYARDFAARRAAGGGTAKAHNRLYAVESTPTLVGAQADHRLALPASQVETFARALAQELGIAVAAADGLATPAFPTNWITAIASDLTAHAGASLVLAGDHQPPAVHALAHAINDHLKNVGATVEYITPVVANPIDQTQSLQDLVTAMNAGKVELLLIVSTNPVYHAPIDVDFAAALGKVPYRVHMGLYVDETAAQADWHLPEAHYLECWSDARAYDGTATIQQPLIEPLYGGLSVHQLLDALTTPKPRSDHDIVQAFWKSQRPEADLTVFWQTSLHDGVVAQTVYARQSVTLERGFDQLSVTATEADGSLEIYFRADPTVWDGRFANNGWLQELPKPLTKLTWENAAHISPQTAAAYELASGDVVELTYQGKTVEAPVWIMPGHADSSVTLHLGYGRTHAGRVGDGLGVNAYSLRTAGAPWSAPGLTLRKSASGYRLASAQAHNNIEGRDLVRVGTVEEFSQDPHFAQAAHAGEEITLYPEVKPSEYAWGMAIDLNACNGCNACVTACQAENNIPVVGKEQVLLGREMHWIRLDRYYAGDPDNPDTYHQPVTCMHCENAPCEAVCPVAATTHDHEGLNTMAYNRCIGTRYCSNNCPYKVRRFNFLEFTDFTTESLRLQRNPNVTVRGRGVMEKCTYCVQRISAARIAAKLGDRAIGDGEIVTACQAACPTQAIVFGNINDPNSDVSKLKASPLNYGILTELNTHPRTTYLARLRNPNPELEPAEPIGEQKP